jgi:hypothetical protein
LLHTSGVQGTQLGPPDIPWRRRQLSLSTNNIERVANLGGLGQLEVLSLARNLIKKLEGFEGVAETLRELWISYNLLEKLASAQACMYCFSTCRCPLIVGASHTMSSSV